MDQSTQQNAAMVEETSAAARNLASEVGHLAEQASRFNVGRSAARHRPTPPVQAMAYASPVKPLSAARTPVMAGTAEDWNEF